MIIDREKQPSTFNFRLKWVDWSLRNILRLNHILNVIYLFLWVVCESLLFPADKFKSALPPRRPVPTSRERVHGVSLFSLPSKG